MLACDQARSVTKSRVLVVATGGTIFQKANAEGQMHLGLTVQQLFASLQEHLTSLGAYTLLDLRVRSGAELTFGTVFRVRDAVLQHAADHDGFVFITGTDTLEEAAFALALLLDRQLREWRKTLAITAAMLPSDQLGYDGAANVVDAVKVVANQALAAREALSAVVAVMNSSVHLGRYVYKGDSQLIGAFQSHPGPMAQLRGGRPAVYYCPPPLPRCPDAFARLTAAGLRDRVPIWVLTAQAFLPEELLQAGLDGLVLAGSGSGSVPGAIVDLLSPKWTSQIPVVIVSRCQTGQGYDDYYYKGSREKYESRGFILGGEYASLNPLQARTLLIFRLSALGHG